VKVDILIYNFMLRETRTNISAVANSHSSYIGNNASVNMMELRRMILIIVVAGCHIQS
jgi:hypothetical protein